VMVCWLLRGRSWVGWDGWGAAVWVVMDLGLGFVLFPPFFSKLPPTLKNQCSLVFIGKVLLGFQTSPSTFPFLLFSSFFVNFDFSYFLYFWKRANINIDSMRKINDFKNDAWKVERVPNVFENFNSFWDDAKNAKNDTNV
jgi:hypothetical protein